MSRIAKILASADTILTFAISLRILITQIIIIKFHINTINFR